MNLQIILDTTVTQVRQLLGCDRVNIWQLDNNGEVIVVAESKESALSLIKQQVKDGCMRQEQIEMYRQGKIRVVPDIYTMEMSDCHRNLLIQTQTRAKILVPIVCDDQLWGFLNAIESQHPREWQESEIELLQNLSVQLAIAIHQASTHEQLQEQLIKRQQAELTLQKLIAGTAAVTGEDFFPALVHHIAEALAVRYALVTKLVGDQLHTLGFWANGALQPSISYHLAHTLCEFALRDGEFYCQSQLQELFSFPDDLDLVTMQADSYLGISLKDNFGNAIGNLCILDVQPLQESRRQEAITILQIFAARVAAELQRQVANDALHSLNQDLEVRVEQRTQELRESEKFLQTVLDTFPLSVFWKDRAYVIVPIFVGESPWGFLGMYQNSQPYLWTTAEIELLEQIASQLAIAIYQASLYEQAQSELIIRQHTEAAISRQLQQQRILGTIVQKIRESLDIKDILATVTQESKDLQDYSVSVKLSHFSAEI